MTDPIRILFVDDEAEVCELVSRMLGEMGPLVVTTALSAEEATHIIHSDHPDVIISDYAMPGTDGITLLKNLRAEGDSTPFIILSGRGNERMVIDALNSQADFYLDKGEDIVATIQLLHHFIAQAVGRHRADEAILTYSKHLEEMVQDRTRRLIEAQRLAIIGETTLMIGQDLQRPLDLLARDLDRVHDMVSPVPPPGDEAGWAAKMDELLSRAEKQVLSMKKILFDLRESVNPQRVVLQDIPLKEYYETVIRIYPFPHGTVLSSDIPADIVIRADPALLDRIFFHILNSASETSIWEGTLTFHARSTPDLVSVLIADRDWTQPVERGRYLFRPLLSPSPGPYGPGLPVIQHLLAIQGGDITVSSSLRSGTLIILRFPRGTA